MAISKGAGGSVNVPLASGAAGGPNAFGEPYLTKVTGLSSDITTAQVTLLTAVNGDILVEDVVVETDATGLAGGTNVQVNQDGTIGLANILVETVANLGANKTVNLDTASVTKQRCVITSGSHLRINATVANCTGAGVWNMWVKWRPVTTAAVLA